MPAFRLRYPPKIDLQIVASQRLAPEWRDEADLAVRLRNAIRLRRGRRSSDAGAGRAVCAPALREKVRGIPTPQSRHRRASISKPIRDPPGSTGDPIWRPSTRPTCRMRPLATSASTPLHGRAGGFGRAGHGLGGGLASSISCWRLVFSLPRAGRRCARSRILVTGRIAGRLWSAATAAGCRTETGRQWRCPRRCRNGAKIGIG